MKIDHNEETGVITFDSSLLKLEHDHLEKLKNIRGIPHFAYYELRHLLRFYGPNPAQFKDYLLEAKTQDDGAYKYIQGLLNYFFVTIQRLKSKSNLHKFLLEKDEQFGISERLKEYFKKFKKIEEEEEGGEKKK
jgi:hypothetical protein